ncbi:hypothetical protein FZD47_24035 [Bacillus infantis]|uniref:Uncharacterized protein n=1 Tax=Bacillus infantis TaxID=324767 RepID=A0A5D4S4L5_9BACI|nr:hypothetical protein [Bacillus infantis]TYS57909.1 hypothetical protein FZD47_24035 [Bacillus infantis]
MSVEVKITVNNSSDAAKVAQRYLSVFGEVVKVEMQDYEKYDSDDHLLTLTNKDGDKMLVNYLTSGYVGHGPNNLKKILVSAGYEKEKVEELVSNNNSFNIQEEIL